MVWSFFIRAFLLLGLPYVSWLIASPIAAMIISPLELGVIQEVISKFLGACYAVHIFEITTGYWLYLAFFLEQGRFTIETITADYLKTILLEEGVSIVGAGLGFFLVQWLARGFFAELPGLLLWFSYAGAVVALTFVRQKLLQDYRLKLAPWRIQGPVERSLRWVLYRQGGVSGVIGSMMQGFVKGLSGIKHLASSRRSKY